MLKRISILSVICADKPALTKRLAFVHVQSFFDCLFSDIIIKIYNQN